MDKTRLITSVTIDGVECEFNSDYRDILNIFKAFNDPDLLDSEKVIVGLQLFYKTADYKINVNKAVTEMLEFMSYETEDELTPQTKRKPLYDWEQDYAIIIAPINKILNTDIRGLDYLHWWTFLSAFMEIGESTFNTYVGIRDKLNHGKKLEKYEEKILRDNRNKVILKPKVDTTTQSILDDIMGV